MKRHGIRLSALVALAALAAPAAPNATALAVRANNQALAALRRSVESACGRAWTRKAKDFAVVSSNITEMVRLVTLKEGAADAMTYGDVLALKARAYADPINLRFYDEAKAAYDAAVAAQEDADRQARVAYARARYLFLCGQEPVEPCRKAMADAYRTPGLSPATRLDLLKEGVPGLSFRVEGRAVAEASGDPAVLRAWYVTETTPNRGRDADPLDPVNCADRRLALCEEALAKLPSAYRAEFANRKLAALRDLSRWDEAEQLLLARLAALTNAPAARRAAVCGELADLCVARADRYYQKPDESLTRRAIGFWEEGLAIDPKNAGFCRKIVERAMLIDDYAAASEKLDALTALMRDGKPDAWICAVRGDIAYFREDYETAVKWYQAFPKFPDAPAVVRIPNSHQRFVGALFATGRYEACLKALDQCPNWWSFKDANAHFRRILEAKLAERKPAAER